MIRMTKRSGLYSYGNLFTKLEIDECKEDIVLEILYHDHGDEFLVIKTKEGKIYEYGLYLNRPTSKRLFIRKPKLYCAKDENAKLSNDMYRTFHNIFYDKFTDTIIKNHDKQKAQHNIDVWIDMLYSAYGKGIHYNKSSYKRSIMEYMESNDVLTEDNIQRIALAPWTSRREGYDGVCGKRELNPNGRIYGDGIYELVYKGTRKNIEKLKYKIEDYDEWGFTTYSLSLKQFK